MSRPGVPTDPAPAAVKIKARAERMGWEAHLSARATCPLPVCGWASTVLRLGRDDEVLTMLWTRATAHSGWSAHRAWLLHEDGGWQVTGMGVKAATAFLSAAPATPDSGG
jgi:hypothetical protein